MVRETPGPDRDPSFRAALRRTWYRAVPSHSVENPATVEATGPEREGRNPTDQPGTGHRRAGKTGEPEIPARPGPPDRTGGEAPCSLLGRDGQKIGRPESVAAACHRGSAPQLFRVRRARIRSRIASWVDRAQSPPGLLDRACNPRSGESAGLMRANRRTPGEGSTVVLTRLTRETPMPQAHEGGAAARMAEPEKKCCYGDSNPSRRSESPS